MGVVVGDKVGAKHMCFVNDDRTTRCAWFSMIQVDNKMVFIKDESAPKGIAEATSRYLAIKRAKECRDRMQTKEAVVSHRQ
ncbi:hypothetical protein M5X06_12715 [Paenibacillus alvei]|uniref:Uncharacterized protein n=1 Tax=Paenibacillus alvei TaxID=44250 RepID=A0ABT4GUL5_PAEAL|nr:hypothetical protein [Paenibacillus alvei]MCY9760382.1 hypothetical protein [Paenibacillus alvei]MCY9767674.1 hypothetical protein [Paenibacillus alvei]